VTAPPVTVDVHIGASERTRRLEEDVRRGLFATPKSLPPIWFYDERGSQLFDEITRLVEYYPTRAERSILEDHADEIVAATECDTMVELGSGTSEKTVLILDAMARADRLTRFVPFDVSEEVLREAAAAIASRYRVPVHAVVGDFHRHLSTIPTEGRRLVAFLGGTIGNLRPAQRKRFYADLDVTMGHQDRFLLGIDLVKEPSRLVAAYDDAAGVTAEFNRNVLSVLNRRLEADFDPGAFTHVALWSEAERWIEMRLRSNRRQRVRIKRLDTFVEFDEGEDLLTEISAKFDPDRIAEELWAGGFVVEKCWTDDPGDFALVLSRPYC
jgi:L-histidine Nalpha-methyltransferase